MNYSIDQIVKIVNGNGNSDCEVIISKIDCPGDHMFWIRVGEFIHLFSEHALNQWNINYNTCQCGSKKLGHLRRSYWCDVYEISQ